MGETKNNNNNNNKNKIITTLLSCVLILSVGVNIYTIWRMHTANKQVAVFSTNVIEADDTINNLQKQLSEFNDLQALVSTLQSQLEESKKQISTLEDSLAESDSQIESLIQEIAENRETITSLESQQPISTPTPNNNTSSNTGNTTTPANPMPTRTDGGYFGQGGSSNIDTGIVPGTLGVGTFE